MFPFGVKHGGMKDKMWLTWRKRIPVVMPRRNKTLDIMFGRTKGKAIRNLLPPKTADRFSAGLAKNPPNEGPKMEPRLQTKGMMEKALGCSSFSGTISATIVLIIPTSLISLLSPSLPLSEQTKEEKRDIPFPLQPPAIALLKIAIGKLVLMPQTRLANIVNDRPIRIVGFRPK
jgi:hypothetical protein